ncbi:MAG: serine hydrolase domain-containing protein [Fulvivirga sp.]|uniref:serine hydrolase domain-containing protein n=1 Tax=Fulvivirga sp. TaxID=1931237 RepID=UPI0032F03AEF
MRYTKLALTMTCFIGINIYAYSFTGKIDSLFNDGIQDNLIPGGILALNIKDSISYSNYYGLSDYSKKIRTTDSTLFQIGSVGKIFTSIAVLQLVDKGLLNLDVEINHYLDDWKIHNPYDQPVTLRNLLTHSAGFNDRFIGYQACSNKDMDKLGEHLAKRMPSLFQSPGTEINYSNYSYALAGYIVAQVSGIPYEMYVKKNILFPCGMLNTTFDMPDNYEEINIYAKGYKTRETFEFVKNYPRNINPAGGILTSAKDMLSFVQELVDHQTLLSNTSYKLLFSTQFRTHKKLTGYSLGFEEQKEGELQYWVKGGNVQGALSFLIILPQLKAGVFYAVNTQTDNFSTILNRFLKSQFDVASKNDVINSDNKKTAVIPSNYEGFYRNNRHNRESIEDFFSLFLNPIHVSITPNGIVNLNMDGKSLNYEQIDERVFQSQDNSNHYLTFNMIDDELHLNLDYPFSGFTIPASFVKVPEYKSLDFINTYYPSFLIPLVLYPLILLIDFTYRLFLVLRKRISSFGKTDFHFHIPLIIFFGLFTLDILFFLVPIFKNVEGLATGMPELSGHFKYLHILMIPSLVLLVYYLLNYWKRSTTRLVFKIYTIIFILSSCFWLYFLMDWNFFLVIY